MLHQERVPSFVRVYSAFAAAYLLSYLFRTVNAVISPELTRELALQPGSLGLLTSTYFVAFAAMQLPLGMLLDHYGPRRVEPVLLAIAALGALLFALADGLPGLTIARGLIGAGVAACLMAPLKGIIAWYPRERHAALSGWMMVAGGLGALAATAPLEYALRFATWREIFLALAGATFAVALWIAWKVPDLPPPQQAQGFAAQWSGVRSVFSDARFWWITPLVAFSTGSFMAVQGLWAVPWMMDVEQVSRAEAARMLLAMGIAILVGYILIATLATRLGARGVKPRHLVAAGFTSSGLAFAAILAQLPGSILWWSIYGLGVAANVLVYAVLNEGFPKELAARANTAVNLVVFLGSFASQWGIGVVVDLARAALGYDGPSGLRLAFAMVLVFDAATLAWFFAGWRRNAVHMSTVTTG